MKVMHIVAGDLNGGAARGAYWLHQAMRSLGIDSVVYTNSRATQGDASVVTTNSSKMDLVVTQARSQIDQSIANCYPGRQSALFSTGMLGADFTRSEEYRSADVVHMHWINAGFLNMRHLAKVNKPLIWTMRGMWPMPGGCHYAMGCAQFETGCGSCKQLGSRSERDLSRLVIWRKKKYLPSTLKLIGISDWLTEQARRSELFHGFDVRTIHNNVDSTEYFPIDKQLARQMLGIDTHKKIVLAGSTNARDLYKGFDKYIEALEHLDPDKYHLCFFGKLEKTIADGLGFDHMAFGFLHDSVSLRLVYSAADVFVAFSLMKVFGKTLAESLSCGTPVVWFDAIGPKNIVAHGVDGFWRSHSLPEAWPKASNGPPGKRTTRVRTGRRAQRWKKNSIVELSLGSTPRCTRECWPESRGADLPRDLGRPVHQQGCHRHSRSTHELQKLERSLPAQHRLRGTGAN